MALPVEERSAMLDAEIRKYVQRGQQVTSRGVTTAQLVKLKKFSFI